MHTRRPHTTRTIGQHVQQRQQVWHGSEHAVRWLRLLLELERCCCHAPALLLLRLLLWR
jgi:hypothetical protein